MTQMPAYYPNEITMVKLSFHIEIIWMLRKFLNPLHKNASGPHNDASRAIGHAAIFSGRHTTT